METSTSAARTPNQILRYDDTTGAFIDVFVSAGSGGLDSPRGLVFGPDGNLRVVSFITNSVKRYNGTTGAFIDDFVTSGSGGLSSPQGLTFGPDGNLYVASQGSSQVLRYNGTTGAFIDVFASGGGLLSPRDLDFGPNGNLYVGSFQDEVPRYNGTTGAFIDVFASGCGLDAPTGVLFDPNGDLCVGSQNGNVVARFDRTTGACIGNCASDGGLSSPTFLVFALEAVCGSPKMYWTDSEVKKIVRCDLDGSNQEILFDEADGLQAPQGIALDPEAGQMYWTVSVPPPDGTPTDPPLFAAVRRANMDGSGAIEDLLTFADDGIVVPMHIVLDPPKGVMFFTDFAFTANRVHRAVLDGSGLVTLVQYPTEEFVSPWGIGLDPVADKLYWGLFHYNQFDFGNTIPGQPNTLLSLPDCGINCGPTGLSLDLTNRMLYWLVWPADASPGGSIHRADLDNPVTIEDLFTSGVQDLVSIALDVSAGKMYWTEGFESDRIRRANMDGSGVIEDLITTGVGFPRGIALDLSPRGDECPACPPPGLAFTETYELLGDANDTPWSWCIRFTDSGLPDICDFFVPGVPMGGTALDVAETFAASINTASAAQGCASPSAVALDVFGTVSLSINASGQSTFELWVGAANTDPDCQVATSLPACDFNPSIEEIPLPGMDCNQNGWDDYIDLIIGTSEDCNENGIPDECDIDPTDPYGDGEVSPDCNGNLIPDECEEVLCEGDANGDCVVDPLDSGFVLARFGCTVGAGDPDCDAADVNGDGEVNPLDSGFVLARFWKCS